MLNFATAYTTRQHVSSLLLLGGFSLALIACQSHKAPPQDRRLELHGVVVSIERSERSVVVKHDEISGFMSAMTMPYEVADAKDLDKLSPGAEIRADVVLTEGSTKLENIRVIKQSSERTPDASLPRARLRNGRLFRFS